MSEFEQDPSASTARFQAFVERADEDFSPSRRSSVRPAVLVIACAVVIALVIIVVVLA